MIATVGVRLAGLLGIIKSCVKRIKFIYILPPIPAAVMVFDFFFLDAVIALYNRNDDPPDRESLLSELDNEEANLLAAIIVRED